MKKGVITTYVLVFGGVFLIFLSAILGFSLIQLKNTNQRIAWNATLHLAEAGVNYYRWCLNHNVENSCSSQKEIYDLNGYPLGGFNLEIKNSTTCATTTEIEVLSVGFTDKFPNVKRKIKVSFSKKSVAEFAYLINDNVWAGEDRVIRGLYHSNGGIRMDGQNLSIVSSAQNEWVCTASFGCSQCPTDSGCEYKGGECVCPGVFTTTQNSNPDLFEYPTTPFDFDKITVDLAKIKQITQNYPLEKYFPPVQQIDPLGKGYHIKFLGDGRFEVWIITSLFPTLAYSLEEGWHYDYFIISQEYKYGTFLVDTTCPLIFVEDDLWIEGTVKGKVTVVSADLENPNNDTNIILPNNIDYTKLDGSDGLVLIAENNMLISPDSPDEMILRGILVAQKGHFGRNLYWGNIRDNLIINGSIVSNGRVGTKWSAGSWIVSGYQNRENYIDTNLIYHPPPFTPYISSQFQIVNWEEMEE